MALLQAGLQNLATYFGEVEEAKEEHVEVKEEDLVSIDQRILRQLNTFCTCGLLRWSNPDPRQACNNTYAIARSSGVL